MAPLDLSDLVRSQLEYFGETRSRIIFSGPPVTVPPTVAQALGMALHELATNAAKHGNLSNQLGRVEITWVVEKDVFCMSWSEIGGPVVTATGAAGFGNTVLKKMTETVLSGDVRIDYAPEGVVWQLRCPLWRFTTAPARTRLSDSPGDLSDRRRRRSGARSVRQAERELAERAAPAAEISVVPRRQRGDGSVLSYPCRAATCRG